MEQDTEKEKVFYTRRRGKKMSEKIESAVLRSLENFEVDFERGSFALI